MRKFDGIEEPTPQAAKTSQKWWAGMHRRPTGALVTAMAIALLSVPVALITLRNEPHSVAPPMSEPAAVQPRQEAVADQPAAPQAQADEIAVAEEPAQA